MLQMVYGGSPLDWWRLTPIQIAGYLANRAKAEAYQSLRRVTELMVADPAFEKAARQRQMDRWKESAGMQEQERPLLQKIDRWREMGMQIEMVQ